MLPLVIPATTAHAKHIEAAVISGALVFAVLPMWRLPMGATLLGKAVYTGIGTVVVSGVSDAVASR